MGPLQVADVVEAEAWRRVELTRPASTPTRRPGRVKAQSNRIVDSPIRYQ